MQMGLTWVNTDAISERLFSAPVDFGQILALIFGEENSERFINLLSTHIIAMEALFNAQKNGDEQLVNDNAIRIYENADEIASFLLQINPFWNQAQWRNLLYNYIDMTFQQSIALLTRNFHQDIDVFDRISYHTVLMGDYMANGIIQYLAIRGT
jgi:hypothetical protein